MDEITIDDKTYISSKRAAAITGYAKDYVGQLCREGRVEARLIGRSWYVLEDSIRKHRFDSEETVVAEPKQEEASEITNNEAIWTESVYTPEEIEMLPVKEEKPEATQEPVTTLEVERIPEEGIELEVSEDTEPDSGHIGNGISEQEDTSEVRPESEAAWESWFSETPTGSDQPVTAPTRSYKAYSEEIKPVKHPRNVAFDIDAIEPVEEKPAIVVKERRVKGKNYLVIKALAVATVVLFVSLAVIGSGFIETSIHASSWGIINILGGTSIIN